MYLCQAYVNLATFWLQNIINTWSTLLYNNYKAITCLLHMQQKLRSATTDSYMTIFVKLINKNTPGEKKSEAKSEAPVSSYSYMQLKSVISG